jgi:hypothetical protein
VKEITKDELYLLKMVLETFKGGSLASLRKLVNNPIIAHLEDYIRIREFEWDFSTLDQTAEETEQKLLKDWQTYQDSVRQLQEYKSAERQRAREKMYKAGRKEHRAKNKEWRDQYKKTPEEVKTKASAKQRPSKQECLLKIHQMFYEVGSIASGDPWIKTLDKNYWQQIVAEMVELGQITKTKIRHNRYTYSRTEKLPAPQSAVDVQPAHEAIQLELIPTTVEVSANN